MLFHMVRLNRGMNMKRKVLFGSLALFCLLIAICVYFAHPKYVFSLQNSDYTRGSYVFAFYGSHTMVVTYGYKKPHDVQSIKTAKDAQSVLYRRKENFNCNLITRIGIRQLSKQQYEEFLKLFSVAEKKQPKYVYEYDYNLPEEKKTIDSCILSAPLWEGVFKTRSGIANIYFLWDFVLGGEPTYAEIIKKRLMCRPYLWKTAGKILYE